MHIICWRIIINSPHTYDQMKTILTFTISLFSFALFSCNSQKAGNNAQDTTKAEAKVMVGGDQDEHGCKASAGYQWSVVKQECIRPFELTDKMKDLTDSTMAGFLLFSDDKKQVEIFAKEFKTPLVMGSQEAEVFISDDKLYKLEKDAQKHWVLYKNEDGKARIILEQV